MSADSTADWKRVLYTEASSRAGELALAAHELLGGPPTAEQWTDLLDFFCIEWVDARGFTQVEHAVRAGALPAEALRWPREVRTALWVVDGWEGDAVLLRDVGTEDTLAVHAPGARGELGRRAVLRARILPMGERHVFSGEPDVWEPMGVLARMDLWRAWHEGPEPALVARLAALRAAFLRQREERDAFVVHFGTDEVIFSDARDMELRMAKALDYVLNQHPMPSLGGRTRATAYREAKGEDPRVLQLTLGPTLAGPGRHGAIYDEVEGLHFLPAYGELLAHLDGREEHPELVRAYLEDPGITMLPFRRARGLGRIGEDALRAAKGGERRARPSFLPGPEDER